VVYSPKCSQDVLEAFSPSSPLAPNKPATYLGRWMIFPSLTKTNYSLFSSHKSPCGPHSHSGSQQSICPLPPNPAVEVDVSSRRNGARVCKRSSATSLPKIPSKPKRSCRKALIIPSVLLKGYFQKNWYCGIPSRCICE
jgi:hypothetical protein